MKNNFAYIDGQNLHFGIKSMGWKLDHKKFRQYLAETHSVTKAYIFLGYMEEHQDLYNVLQEAGFICFFKPLVRYDDGSIKGNVDADMVLQVMVDFDKYDQAVIVSGDGDFSGLLRHLITNKKLGQVIIPNKDKYSSLFDRLDGFDTSHVTYMNDMRGKLSYRVGNGRRGGPRSKQTSSKPTAKDAPRKPYTKTKPASQTVKKARKPAPKKRDNTGFKPKSVLEKSLIETIDKVA